MPTAAKLVAAICFALLGLLYVPQLATISATFPAMFPTAVRFAGFAIAYNISTSIFGGTAPLVATWLIGQTGSSLAPAFYLVVIALVALVGGLALPETSRISLHDDLGVDGVRAGARRAV